MAKEEHSFLACANDAEKSDKRLKANHSSWMDVCLFQYKPKWMESLQVYSTLLQ